MLLRVNKVFVYLFFVPANGGLLSSNALINRGFKGCASDKAIILSKNRVKCPVFW